jgi:hypothetical protein
MFIAFALASSKNFFKFFFTEFLKWRHDIQHNNNSQIDNKMVALSKNDMLSVSILALRWAPLNWVSLC